MVHSCAAYGCTNRWVSGSNISFHRLPTREDIKKQWLLNVKREGILPQDRFFFICSDHFEDNCFQRDLKAELTGVKGKKKLKEGAVPTKFSFAPDVKRRKLSEKRAESSAARHEIDLALNSATDIQNSITQTEDVDMGMSKNSSCQATVKTKEKHSQCDFALKCNKCSAAKIKISKKPTRSKACNTDLTFDPKIDVVIYATPQKYSNLEYADSPEKLQVDDEFLDPPFVQNNDFDSNDKGDERSEVEEDEYLSDAMESNVVSEPKFIVFWTCLLSLFQKCFQCLEKNIVTAVSIRGSLLLIKTTCINSHQYKWESQPIVQGTGAGNILFSAAILYSGNTYQRISELLNMINVAYLKRSRYYELQRTILFPVLNSFYKVYREKVSNQCLSTTHSYSGDGRSDSPGFSAKYGTYSLMNTDLNRIVDFHIVHVRTAGNSSRMEKLGLQTLLQKFETLQIPITSLTTDRHVQIRAFLKKEYPDILHQFDVWHFSKSIKKCLSNLSHVTANAALRDWIKSIINHFWWCCATSDGKEAVLREKWLSILQHIRNIHSWDGNTYFHECEHGPLEKQRMWLSENSPAYQALKSVVEKKKTLDDLKYLIQFRHTGNLEVFHSLINKYCPKRLHFSIHGMIARTQLAVLDYNSGSDNQQQTTKDGELCYKQTFSRITQSWVVKKVMKTKSRDFFPSLLISTITEASDIDGKSLPLIEDIPRNISTVEKPDKGEAILNMKTRFKTV